MNDTPTKSRLCKFKRVVIVLSALSLLLAAIVLTPFLLTTPLARLALRQIFPAHTPSIGSAALSPWGALVLRDLALHDTGVLAQQPLITASEVRAEFRWVELLSLRIRRVSAPDVIVYARSNGPLQLSLLPLVFRSSPDSPLAEFGYGAVSLQIDTLTVQGLVRVESVRGLTSTNANLPLALDMTVSGDRMAPARQFRLTVGETQSWPGKISEKPSRPAPELAPQIDATFGLRAEVDTQPLAGNTSKMACRLVIRHAAFMIEAATLRRYVARLPVALHGPLDASFAALDVTGLITPEPEKALKFNGDMRLQDLSMRLPANGAHVFALERLTVAGRVESRLDRWTPAALSVRNGVLQWATLAYSNNTVNNLDASWRIDKHVVMVDQCAAQIFGGRLDGSLAWDLVASALPRCDFQIKNINIHEALANLSPEYVDAEGEVSGSLHVASSPETALSGFVALTFDKPGVLRIGEIEEIKQMLVGNFGLDLANLAMRDLRQYPFQSGRLYLESVGENSEVKIHFVRQPRTEADVTPPRKEIINGKEVWVGSLIVPTIDMTIPITGKSLAEILSLASGVHPLSEAASEQPGK
jgi:hypothetical protein